jgi:hypothetical protein
VFLAVSCGKSPTTHGPGAAPPDRRPPARENTGLVTLHVKNMTKDLGLV